MKNAIEMLHDRRLDLLREKAEREYRQQRRAEIPGERERLTEKLEGQKAKLATLHEITKADLAAALARKKKAEEENGKEDPEYILSLASLKAMQKAAKDYNDTKGDVTHNEKKLKDMAKEEAALAETAEEDSSRLAILPHLLDESAVSITTASQAVTWEEKLAAVAKKCKKQFEKTGTAYPCPGCDFFSAQLGKCSVMAEWGCTPMNWHVGEMEKAVDSAYRDEAKLKRLQKKKAEEAEAIIEAIMQGGTE